MTIKGLAQNIFLVLVILLFFPIIIGGVLNMPVGLSYVETESMMPQLEPGDGFMLIPSQLVDGYEIGDVITYNAQNFPYDYVTHRIVGVTSQGFITQGDNNTFTDQTGSFLEPYVKEEQIAGKVLELNGNIVSIPHFGDAINFIGDSIRGLSNRFYSFIGIDGVDEKVGSIVMSVGILAVLVFVWESLAGIIVKSRKIVRKKRPKARSNLLLYGVFILFLVFATSVSVISMSQNNLVEFVATEGNTSSR
nr:signal peptidase I [Candidatus Methanofastidiosa archaeon]